METYNNSGKSRKSKGIIRKSCKSWDSVGNPGIPKTNPEILETCSNSGKSQKSKGNRKNIMEIPGFLRKSLNSKKNPKNLVNSLKIK